MSVTNNDQVLNGYQRPAHSGNGGYGANHAYAHMAAVDSGTVGGGVCTGAGASTSCTGTGTVGQQRIGQYGKQLANWNRSRAAVQVSARAVPVWALRA